MNQLEDLRSNNELNYEQQEELKDKILSSQEVKNLIFAAQICLLEEHAKFKKICDRLTGKVKSLCGKDKNLSSEVMKNINGIIRQILNSLKEQKSLFINELVSKFMSSYEVNEQGNVNPLLKLRILLIESRKIFDLPQENKGCKPLFSEEDWTKLLAVSETISGHDDSYRNYRILAIFAMLYCFGLGILDIYEQQKFELNSFQIRNFGFLIFSLLTYVFIGEKAVNFTANLEKKELSVKETPTFNLKNIKIIDVQTGEIKNDIYQPSFKLNKNIENGSQMNISTETKTLKEKRWRTSVDQQESPKNEQPGASLQFPGESVMFGDPANPIQIDEAKKIKSSSKKNGGDCAFFNGPALSKQNILAGSREWNAYENRLNDPHFSNKSGIKSLRCRIKTNVKIGDQRSGPTEYKYEVKIPGEKFRLLGGKVATIKDKDGNKYNLIDFNLHLKNGLH